MRNIEQVVLYPDMAMIKKTGRVSLRQGETFHKIYGGTSTGFKNKRS